MNMLRQFMVTEDAMGVVEIILIIVVLIAMVAIFKDEIENLVEDIWDSIEDSAGKIY